MPTRKNSIKRKRTKRKSTKKTKRKYKQSGGVYGVNDFNSGTKISPPPKPPFNMGCNIL